MADAVVRALDAIAAEHKVSGASGASVDRLLALGYAALELADRWKRQSTTGYDASALHASELLAVVSRELGSEEGSDA